MKWSLIVFLLIGSEVEAGVVYKAKRFKLSRPKERVVAMGPFLKDFRPQFVADLCDGKSYFSTCFKIDTKPCKSEITKALMSCQNKNKKKYRPHLKETQAFKYIKQLGYCTGKRAEVKWAKMKQDSYKCRDIALWW